MPEVAAAGIGEVEADATALDLACLADTDDLHLRALQALGDFGLGDDQCAAAVRDHAAVEPMQRIGDHGRIHDLFDRHHLRQHRVRIVLGVVGRCDLHPGELLRRGAELVHVAAGRHGVHVRRRRPVGKLELQVGLLHVAHAGCGAGRHAFRARPTGERHERDIAAAGRNCLERVADMDVVGRATGVGRIDVAELEAHVFDHREAAEARRVAGRAEIPVDVTLAQPRVVESTLGDLRMQLRQ